MNYLEEYYNNYNEEGRLLSRHGQVEYLTTMRYIEACLEGLSEPSILEVGAGTGRYSVALAKQGIQVTAVELIRHNLEVLKSKLDGTEPITTMQANALDLSRFPDDSFDLTLLLGPMYHLYTNEEKLRALSEAVRVTKPGGYILVAYCMNEPTVIQYVFGMNHLQEVMELHMLTPDWHCISEPKDVFELVRTEDIAVLDAAVPVKRIKLVATDGATNYDRAYIDAMDDATFAKWMDYHFAICERQDLIGASHHTLDILQKNNKCRLVEEIMKNDIAYCGVDCAKCPDFMRQTCPSCKLTEWKDDDMCMPGRCCREKGIESCAACDVFPCREMADFYEESDSHREAYRRMRQSREELLRYHAMSKEL